MSTHNDTVTSVCVVGLGYVGLTLAVSLAEAEIPVVGYEVNPEAVRMLNSGEAHFLERGVTASLKRHLGRMLHVTNELPQRLPPVIVICVGTPIDHATHQPDLHQLTAAVHAIADRITDQTLTIVRSTVSIGTSRNVVLPLLQAHCAHPLLAFCPERTIQGKALEELRNLPQIVGGVDAASTERAATLFGCITKQVIRVSSLEAAEMVKLICNAHTDLIYGFGNEVACMAEAFGLNAKELITSANMNYPRPDLARPGFVGGSCLVKDPYLLMHSAQQHGYSPAIVAAARQLNESLPQRISAQVVDTLRQRGRDPADATVFISGFTYKGNPETDDLRGAAYEAILVHLRSIGCHIVGHDFVVTPERLSTLGVKPVPFEQGFDGADAVFILNDHVCYATQPIHSLVAHMQPSAVLFDMWGMYQSALQQHPFIHYMSLSWTNVS